MQYCGRSFSIARALRTLLRGLLAFLLAFLIFSTASRAIEHHSGTSPGSTSKQTAKAPQAASEVKVAPSGTTSSTVRDSNRDWQYLIPDAADSTFARPTLSIALLDHRPVVLVREPPKSPNVARQYGLIRYGSAQSIQLAVIVDNHGAGRFELYVNADRDAEITPDELVPGTGNSRRCKLPCEVLFEKEQSKLVEREVVFKRSITGKTLTLATQGYLAGKVQLDEAEIPARCVDGDGNGLFSDARDRLWLDLNRDGKWDSFQEQFALQPLLTLNGKRYAVKTDGTGTALRCEQIVGEGSVQFALTQIHTEARLKEIEITVVGRDGSAFAARTVDQPITLPIGDYALSMVRVVVVMKENEGAQWEFVFSKLDLSDQSIWHTVKRDQTTLVDPVGKMNLTFEWDDRDKPVPAGRQIHVRPILVTQDGLVINSGKCGYGNALNEMHLNLHLCRLDQTRLDSARSGFA